MSARICDPLGPLRARAIVPALTIVLGLWLGWGLFGGWASWTLAATLFVASVVASHASTRARRAIRPATVRIGRDHIELRDAGALSQRIYAHEVVAARTAATASGTSIALVRAHGRNRPMVVDLGDDGAIDVREVRRALRIGPAGFGVLAWDGGSGATLAAALASVETTWFVLFALAVVCTELLGPPAAFFAAAPLTLALRVAWEATAAGTSPRVVLTQDGVVATDAGGQITHTAYGEILAATAQAASLSIRTVRETIHLATPGWLDDERRYVAALIEAAAERAHADGDRAASVPATLTFLERRGESSRSWLERIDATASALGRDDAYRSPHVPVSDLWSALESPDAPIAVRAAAARVLARIAPGEATTRVSEVLATERDAHAREVIHIALEDDVEAAAASLDELSRD
jgi:hypothetical protein